MEAETTPRVGESAYDSDAPYPHALLTDGVDGQRPRDLLEHEAVARAIESIIRGTPSAEPLGVALYGQWGQGKSTVGRLLRERVEAATEDDGRIIFVKIDAWKYAYEDSRLPLRRHFLLQAYADAGFVDEARELREGSRGEHTRSTLKPGIASALRAVAQHLFVWTWKRALIIASIVVVMGIVLDLASVVDLASWLVTVFLVWILGLAFSLLPVVREGVYVTTREDPSWSIEVFDDHLQWLLDATHPKSDDVPIGRRIARFVFFIDDLDRCRDSIVVEAIATLQAFFGKPRCVYVVAIDEAQIKRAVRSHAESPAGDTQYGASIPLDEGFLEKIFQVAVYLPRPSLSAIERYGAEVAEQTRIRTLHETERTGVLAYLIHPGVTSPRQARVIINDFVTTWILAEEREAQPRAHLRRGEITGAKHLLAKLVVLRSHFPWFYALLGESPELLQSWQRHVLREGTPDNFEPTIELVHSAAANAAHESRSYTRNRQSSGDGVTQEGLLNALTLYLSRTRRTLPRDPGQVQQFVYLRSREEFGHLFGGAGNDYRLAIASGDAEAVRRAVSRDRSQIGAAIDAAIAIGREPNPVQRDAARRALLALVGLAPLTIVQQSGRRVASIVYGDEAAALEELQREDVHAHTRLVPWMPEPILRDHLSRAPLNRGEEVATLGLAIASRVPDAWREVVRRAIDEDGTQATEHALLQLAPDVAGRLAESTLAGVRWVFEASPQTFIDVSGVLSDVSERWITLNTSDGEISAYVPRDISLPLGAEITFSGHVDHENDVVVDALIYDGNVTEYNSVPEEATADERGSAWRVLNAVLERSEARRAASAFAEAPSFDWQVARDAGRCIEAVQRLVARAGASRVDALIDAVAASTTLQRWPWVRVHVQRIILGLPAAELRPRASDALSSLVAALSDGVESDELVGLAETLQRARARAGEDVFVEAVSALELPEDDETLDEISQHVLGPASPTATAGVLRARIAQRLADALTAAEEDAGDGTEALLRSVATLRAVAVEYPIAARDEVRRVPLDARIAAYAERVLDLREQVGALGLAIPETVIRSAATVSRRGAELAREHGLRRAAIRPIQLRAILDGVVSFPPRTTLEVDDTRELIRRRSGVIPALDQLAYISSHGRPALAERLFEDGDLLSALFETSEKALGTDHLRSAELLRAIPAWRSHPRRVRQSAGASFARILSVVKTEEQLELVLTSMLAFFEEAKKTERVRDLRRELPKAIRRVGTLRRERVVALLEQAAAQLRIQRSGESWFIDLVHSRHH